MTTLTNDGGVIKPGWIFKFMAIFGFLTIIAIYFMAFVVHPLKPIKNYADVLSLFGIFIVWPAASLVWISWSFLRVKYSSTGILVNNIFGMKRFVTWDSVIGVRYYHRFGARHFALIVNNKKEIGIDMDLEPFSDFLSYVQEHLKSEIEKESRFSIEAARESLRSTNN